MTAGYRASMQSRRHGTKASHELAVTTSCRRDVMVSCEWRTAMPPEIFVQRFHDNIMLLHPAVPFLGEL
jgi:hypothetical protein